MKAIICIAYGPPEVRQLGELDKPTPNPDSHLGRRRHHLRLHHAQRQSQIAVVAAMSLFVGFTRPRNPVLGLDLAGDVDAANVELVKALGADAVIDYLSAVSRDIFG